MKYLGLIFAASCMVPVPACTAPEPYEVPALPPRAVVVCDWDDAGVSDCRLVELIEV